MRMVIYESADKTIKVNGRISWIAWKSHAQKKPFESIIHFPKNQPNNAVINTPKIPEGIPPI